MADDEKIGFNAAWSMAVGGMVGGGIFSVLGVVYSVAGARAWISFIIGGAIALATAYSYGKLAVSTGKSGGAYAFLRQAGHKRIAANLATILILGYALTLSVYAYTFGAYVADALHGPGWVRPALSAAVLILLGGVNLIGVGEASAVEIVTVWGKLAVLGLVAGFGLVRWAPAQLSPSGPAQSWTAPLLAAGVIFMAYEGFQLLAYDYEQIRDADRTLPRAMLTAVVSVIFIYVLIALGSAMLVGADTIIKHREVALAEAGREALGTPGFIMTIVAAAFSTGSAINATLFSTARLSKRMACDGELPAIVARENGRGMPWLAICALTAASLVLAFFGTLSSLVEAASLLFLLTFATVNWLAMKQRTKLRWVAIAGFLGCVGASILLLIRSIGERPLATAALAGIVVLVVAGRWAVERHASGAANEA